MGRRWIKHPKHILFGCILVEAAMVPTEAGGMPPARGSRGQSGEQEVRELI